MNDEVLVLLPTVNHKLETRWQGPFRISRKVGAVNYEVLFPERRKKKKILHINLLRKFQHRQTDFLLFAHEAPSMPTFDQADNFGNQEDV